MQDLHLETLKTSVLPLDTFSKNRTGKDGAIGGLTFEDHLGRAGQSSGPASEGPKTNVPSQPARPTGKPPEEVEDAEQRQSTTETLKGESSDAPAVEATDEEPAATNGSGNEAADKDVPKATQDPDETESEESAEDAAEEAAVVDILELTVLGADAAQPAPIVEEAAAKASAPAAGKTALQSPAHSPAQSAAVLVTQAANVADEAAPLVAPAEPVAQLPPAPPAGKPGERGATVVDKAGAPVDAELFQKQPELPPEVIEGAARLPAEGTASKASSTKTSAKATDRGVPRNSETVAARSMATPQESWDHATVEPIVEGVSSSEGEARRTPQSDVTLSVAGDDSVDSPAPGVTQHEARPVQPQVSTPAASSTTPLPPAGEARGIEGSSGIQGEPTAQGTDNSADVERARFVQRVARAFQSVGSRGGSLRMRLSPPELGALRVEITIRDGAMAAKLEAETPQARTMLLENLPALRERLAEQDIKIERFEVDLLNQSAGGPSEQSTRGGNGEDPAGHAATQRNRIKTQAASANESRAQPASNPALAGRLNVIV